MYTNNFKFISTFFPKTSWIKMLYLVIPDCACGFIFPHFTIDPILVPICSRPVSPVSSLPVVPLLFRPTLIPPPSTSLLSSSLFPHLRLHIPLQNPSKCGVLHRYRSCTVDAHTHTTVWPGPKNLCLLLSFLFSCCLSPRSPGVSFILLLESLNNAHRDMEVWRAGAVEGK